MRYNSSGFYEEKLSLLGLDSDSLPKNEDGSPDTQKCSDYFKTAFENGVTLFFISASGDKGSEKLFGENLSRKMRNEYFLCGSFDINSVNSQKEAKDFFENQILSLKSGYFDYYVIENISSENLSFFTENEIYDVFSKLKDFGKIKHLGFSFSGSGEFGKTILEKYPWDFAKLDLNFYSWEYLDVCGFYHALRKKGVPFIASDPFMGGMILDPPEEVFDILQSGDPLYSMEEWALRWFFDKKGLLCVATSPKDSEEIIKYAEIISSTKTLNSSKKHFLKKAAQEFSKENAKEPGFD